MVVKKSYDLKLGDLRRLETRVSGKSAAVLAAKYGTEGYQYTLEVFYDDNLTEHKGVVFYFSGGQGNLSVSLEHRLVNIARDGWILCNWDAIAHGGSITGAVFWYKWATHSIGSVAAFEADTAVEYFYSKVVNELPTKNKKPICYLLGHSRGAGVVAGYCRLSNSERGPNQIYVQGGGTSSPAGGTGTAPYNALRSFVNGLNYSNKPLCTTAGAGDLTHSPRAMMERANFSKVNDKVGVFVLGDENNGHQSFNGDYIGFFYFCKEFIDEINLVGMTSP